MSRYISVKWLEDNAKEYSLGYYEEDEWATPLNVLDSAPTIEIIRCGECKYWIDDRKAEEDMGTCGLTHYFTNADDFCSYGMRNADSNTLNTLDALDDNSSEKPNNCEVKNYCDDCLYTDTCDDKAFFYACTSKATISKMEQVDEPQTEREGE